jgi:hypothetical protein
VEVVVVVVVASYFLSVGGVVGSCGWVDVGVCAWWSVLVVLVWIVSCGVNVGWR